MGRIKDLQEEIKPLNYRKWEEIKDGGKIKENMKN